VIKTCSWARSPFEMGITIECIAGIQRQKAKAIQTEGNSNPDERGDQHSGAIHHISRMQLHFWASTRLFKSKGKGNGWEAEAGPGLVHISSVS